jgi:VWFA-related protein
MKILRKTAWPVIFLFCFFFVSLNSVLSLKQEKNRELRHEVGVTLKLVQVYVTDKKGNPVLDLASEDFIVRDNGREKTITEFERHILTLPSIEDEKQPEIIRETALPDPRELMGRKFFLLFDFAYNNPRGILKAKKAALHFIDTQLQPPDEVGLLSYSAIKSLTLHEYLTTNHGKVREVTDSFSIKEVLGRAEIFEEDLWRQASGVNPADASKAGGVGSVRIEGSLEIMTGNISPEMVKHMKRQDSGTHALHFVQKMEDFAKALRYIPGYKHIILFSSGVPYSLMYGIHETPRKPQHTWDRGYKLLQLEYEDMLKELAASNSTVYTLDTEDMGTMISVNSRVQGGYTLQTMASSTGGKYFGDINSFEDHLEKIQDLTACYYVLGYYVDEKWDGKYHKLKVRVNRPGCEVHAQKGYFNPKSFSCYSKMERLLHLVDLALSEKHVFQTPLRFPMVALPCMIKEKLNLSLFSMMNRDEIRKLSGKNVELVSIIFDDKENILKIEREKLDFSMLPAGNIYYAHTANLEPGDYKCRIVLRNLETGRGAVASSNVAIPQSADFGLQIYPPLLLKQEKNAHFLKGPPPAYPFDKTRFSPILEELEQGTNRLWAVIRCAFIGIEQPGIQLSSSLERHSVDPEKSMPLAISILDKRQEEGAEVFLIELRTAKLQPGQYTLHLFAKDSLAQSRSQVAKAFTVR